MSEAHAEIYWSEPNKMWVIHRVRAHQTCFSIEEVKDERFTATTGLRIGEDTADEFAGAG